ncbi:MFS transporter [Microbacterium sp. 4R-513]|nr:MFS transporter [Microbacterium sp. 4R-513]
MVLSGGILRSEPPSNSRPTFVGSHPLEGPLVRSSSTRAFLALALSVASLALLQNLVIPVIPLMQSDLGVTADAASWTMTAWLIAAAVATPVLGRVGDLRGRRATFLAVLVVIVIGDLVAFNASNLGVLLIGRVLQGVGGALFPLAFGLIRDTVPRERVTGAIGAMSAIIGIGGAGGRRARGPAVGVGGLEGTVPRAARPVGGRHPADGRVGAPLSSRSPGQAQRGLGGPAVRMARGTPHPAHLRRALGLDEPPRPHAARPRRGPLRRMGHGGAALQGAPRRHPDAPRPRDLADERRRLPRRRRRLRLLGLPPPVPRDGVRDGLGSRPRRPGRGTRARAPPHRHVRDGLRDRRDRPRPPAADAARPRLGRHGDRRRRRRGVPQPGVAARPRRSALRHRHRRLVRRGREHHRPERPERPGRRRDGRQRQPAHDRLGLRLGAHERARVRDDGCLGLAVRGQLRRRVAHDGRSRPHGRGDRRDDHPPAAQRGRDARAPDRRA